MRTPSEREHNTLGRGHQNGLSPRGVAEAVVQVGPTGGELVAAVTAPTTVAEPDVVRRGEAVRAWGVQAGSPAVVHGARAPTDIDRPLVAEGDHGVLGRAGSQRVGRLADEGELGVGVREPVHHLLVGHEVRRRLCHRSNKNVSKLNDGASRCIPRRQTRKRSQCCPRWHRAVDKLAGVDDMKWVRGTHCSERRGIANADQSEDKDSQASEGVGELHCGGSTKSSEDCC